MSECLFCKIVARTIPATLVYEDDLVVAFDDINPQAPTHTLVIPRKHVTSIAELEDSDVGLLGRLMLAGNKIAKLKGIADSGYRFVINTGEAWWSDRVSPASPCIGRTTHGLASRLAGAEKARQHRSRIVQTLNVRREGTQLRASGFVLRPC